MHFQNKVAIEIAQDQANRPVASMTREMSDVIPDDAGNSKSLSIMVTKGSLECAQLPFILAAASIETVTKSDINLFM